MTASTIEGLLRIEPSPIADDRGFFVRTLDGPSLRAAGLDPARFIQHNQSRSRRGTLRGLHARRELTEGKLVRCARGAVFEVVVDIRPWSSSFLRIETFRLDDEAHLQLFVPPGCVHGFQVLTDWADVCYQHDAVYDPALEIALAWDDPELGIEWPIRPPVLSDRDQVAPPLAAIRPDLQAWYGAQGQPDRRPLQVPPSAGKVGAGCDLPGVVGPRQGGSRARTRDRSRGLYRHRPGGSPAASGPHRRRTGHRLLPGLRSGRPTATDPEPWA
ncbi:MAG: dTDP-4-dehydrorhamnose 3,5-epimerase [Candidatus Limnocylindrales bacterium]